MSKKSKPLYWVVSILIIGAIGIIYFSLKKPESSEKMAPGFTVTTVDGRTISLRSLKGKPLFLNFWSSWCSNCNEEAPGVERAFRKYKKRVNFLGILTQDSRPDGLKFLEKHDITFDNALDPGHIAPLYDLVGHPMAVYINENGQILDTRVGALTDKVIEKDFEQLFF